MLARRVHDGSVLTDLDPLLATELDRLGRNAAAREVLLRHGSLSHAPNLAPELCRRFLIALEIAPEWHVRIQAVFQNHVDTEIREWVTIILIALSIGIELFR